MTDDFHLPSIPAVDPWGNQAGSDSRGRKKDKRSHHADEEPEDVIDIGHEQPATEGDATAESEADPGTDYYSPSAPLPDVTDEDS